MRYTKELEAQIKALKDRISHHESLFEAAKNYLEKNKESQQSNQHRIDINRDKKRAEPNDLTDQISRYNSQRSEVLMNVSEAAQQYTIPNETSSQGSNDSAKTETTFGDQLDNHDQTFVRQLALHVVSGAIQYFENGRLNQRPGSRGESHSSSGTSACTKLSTTSASSHSSLKRPHLGGNGDDDYDEEKGREERPSKKKGSADAKSLRFFACPYAKFDPQRYSVQNESGEAYRKCGSHKLVSISATKQHLKRVHKRPDYYCGRCYESFPNRGAFDDHQNADIRCPRQPESFQEKMTEEQWDAIQRSRLGNSHGSWYKIFQMLFPSVSHERLPLSPYVSTCDAALVYFTEFFKWFGAERLYLLIRERCSSTDNDTDMSLPLRSLIEETFQVALPIAGGTLQQLMQSGDKIDPSNYLATETEDISLAAGMQDSAAECSPARSEKTSGRTDAQDIGFTQNEIHNVIQEFVENLEDPFYGYDETFLEPESL